MTTRRFVRRGSGSDKETETSTVKGDDDLGLRFDWRHPDDSLRYLCHLFPGLGCFLSGIVLSFFFFFPLLRPPFFWIFFVIFCCTA